jgi:predicted CopG family antitoxin
MEKGKTTITVDNDVWAELIRIKADLRLSSYSEVIRRLIDRWRGGPGEADALRERLTRLSEECGKAIATIEECSSNIKAALKELREAIGWR